MPSLLTCQDLVIWDKNIYLVPGVQEHHVVCGQVALGQVPGHLFDLNGECKKVASRGTKTSREHLMSSNPLQRRCLLDLLAIVTKANHLSDGIRTSGSFHQQSPTV